jgi:hypothetical protein
MDSDIRAAMYDPDYDNGDLDDDIMEQMRSMAELDEDEDTDRFDYDAHIAKLIAASQDDLGLIDELSSGDGSDDNEMGVGKYDEEKDVVVAEEWPEVKGREGSAREEEPGPHLARNNQVERGFEKVRFFTHLHQVVPLPDQLAVLNESNAGSTGVRQR